MPVIRSHFKGNKYWRNAHTETILPALFRSINISWQRERLILPDADFMDLDWLNMGNEKLLILFHGLEGSAESQYIKGFARFFCEAGFDICAVNFRNCSGEPNNILRTYHSGASDDIHEVIHHVLKGKRFKEIFLSGFSLGGNVVLKYLGENIYTLPHQLKAAVAISVPMDLGACAKEMATPFNKHYMWMFLSSLNRKIVDMAERYQGQIDISGYRKVKTFEEWDNRFTAPINGFAGSRDYYQKCSSRQFLNGIKIPTLILNAKNDPFLAPQCYPDESCLSDQVYLEIPDFGGHCGFSHDFPNGSYYSEERALHFFSNKDSFL